MNPYGAYAQTNIMTDGQDKGRILVKVLIALLDKMDLVKHYIEQRKFEKKCDELNRIVNVIEILDASLDMSYGDIPKNLSALYRYLTQRLRIVHTTLDLSILDECKGIIRRIADGFEGADKTEKQGRAKISSDSARRSLSSLTA